MHLEIITPEHKIFNAEADAVQLPGKEGLFQILDNHAPIIATLKEGTIKIDLASSHKHLNDLNGHIEYDKSNDKLLFVHIKGGVVECQNNKVIVLAD
jgi:F-type H+-transporting ATPase subunit epsilon